MMFAHGFGCDQNMWRHVSPAFEDRFQAPAEPTQTGSVSSGTNARKAPARKPAFHAREARTVPVNRARRYAGRAPRRVRLAAQPRRSVGHYEAYPRRTAYLPWWSAVPAWGGERGGN